MIALRLSLLMLDFFIPTTRLHVDAILFVTPLGRLGYEIPCRDRFNPFGCLLRTLGLFGLCSQESFRSTSGPAWSSISKRSSLSWKGCSSGLVPRGVSWAGLNRGILSTKGERALMSSCRACCLGPKGLLCRSGFLRTTRLRTSVSPLYRSQFRKS